MAFQNPLRTYSC